MAIINLYLGVMLKEFEPISVNKRNNFSKAHFSASPDNMIPSGSFLLAADVPAVAAEGLDFLERMEDPLLEYPLITDIVSSSPPACREFL